MGVEGQKMATFLPPVDDLKKPGKPQGEKYRRKWI